MALQGTLDTFELPDVLRLLASTRKSGRLHLRSDRGDGDVWLTDGQVVGVEAGTASDVAGALFEMLRAHEGAFAFEPGETPPTSLTPADVEALLLGAEAQLAEWREIEAVVPSLDAWVCLSTELPSPEVTVDAGTWRLISTIGSGLTVAELGRVLGLDEVGVSRVARDLVLLGLGAVTSPPVHAATGGWSAPAYEPEPEPELAAEEPVVAAETPAPLFTVGEPAGYADLLPAEDEPERGYTPAPDPVVVAPLLPPEAFEGADPAEADEVTRQLAMLSPRAAQAVAAAAAAGSDAARQAALEAVDEGDEPVNRGLLLKFLSSVKS